MDPRSIFEGVKNAPTGHNKLPNPLDIAALDHSAKVFKLCKLGSCQSPWVMVGQALEGRDIEYFIDRYSEL